MPLQKKPLLNKILSGFVSMGLAFLLVNMGLSFVDIPLEISVNLLPFLCVFLFWGAGSLWGFCAAVLSSIVLYSLTLRPPSPALEIFLLPLGTLWLPLAFLQALRTQAAQRHQRSLVSLDQVHKEGGTLQQDVSFYRKRRENLLVHSERRKALSAIAAEMGAELDPSVLQEKIIKAVSDLFGSRSYQITVGQNPDAIDRYVMERKQALLIPGSQMKGPPLMAVPIRSQGDVVGILRVGGEDNGDPFERDDLRTLEVVASFASSALDNGILFNQVHNNALRDHLTGLWTHRAFQEALEAEVLNASRYSQKFSLVLSDIDFFKSVNDTYGHQAGDAVLVHVSSHLSSFVRDVDIVSRYGGEEFVLLLLDTSHEDAFQLAESLRHSFEQSPVPIATGPLPITMSFGVSTFPDDATSAQQLLRKADERLYKAKREGRNRVEG